MSEAITTTGRTGSTRPVLSSSLTTTSSIGLGITMLWFSLLVLIPLTAVMITAAEGGWAGFWQAVTNPQSFAAIRITLTAAAVVTAANVVTGTAIAWVLVRDDFRGKAFLELVIDIPFALPTIVAGLVLLSLYGDGGVLGLSINNTQGSIYLAFLFVTLPFVVRMVQPVLEELDGEVEEAAASLGAGRATIFRRIVLPSLAPAIAAGAALSFARAVGEYGSLVLLSGNLPMRSEVASVRILSAIENDNPAAATSIAALLLVISLLVILVIDVVQRKVAARG